jgi:hypothetical protein
MACTIVGLAFSSYDIWHVLLFVGEVLVLRSMIYCPSCLLCFGLNELFNAWTHLSYGC